MLELVGAVLLALVLGYLALMLFVTAGFSTGRRWPLLLAAVAFTAGTVALVVFALSHVHVEVAVGDVPLPEAPERNA